jgi:hypothetical protein
MRNTQILRFLLVGLLSLCGIAAVTAQVPTLINYQGRMVVDGVNFSGNGQFKFALVNQAGNTTFWSHDGSSVGGAVPSTHVVLPVSSGLYSILLGDPTVLNSAGAAVEGIAPAALNHTEVFLRIWFNSGTTGFQQLSPDQRIAAVAYALMADSVPDGSITTAKLADGSVTADKLASSVNLSIADGSITTARLADGSVTAAKLADGSVTADKLASSVNLTIADGSITTARLANGSVTAAKLSVSTDQLISNGSITSAKLAASSVTADKLSGTTSQVVSSGSITSAMLADGSVTADKLASSVNLTIADGSITTARLADGAVTAEKLSVTTSQIVPAGSITTAMLAPGAVTADRLAASASGGNLLASRSANDAGLLAGGFVRVHAIPSKIWQSSSVLGGPSARSQHSAVWTDSDMIVWGGKVGSSLSSQGGVYTPETGTWALLPTSDASPSRNDHTAVWTGDRMIVWGGYLESGATQTGALYAPTVPDASPPIGGWLATSLTAAPAARTGHTALWTGLKMLVWGGKSSGGALGSGGAYTPPTGPLVPGVEGSWSALSNTSAPVARHDHTAIWTGSKMIVWGGLDASFQTLGTGAIYDPANNTWTTLPTTGAPTARTGHSAVWTGSKMLVFGGTNAEVPGSSGNLLNDGAAFDPVSGNWTPLSTVDTPSERHNHGAIWTGSEMLIFLGEALSGQVVYTAAAYNASMDNWRALPTSISASVGQTEVWSGGEILVFGINGLQILDPAPGVYLYGRF